MVLCVMLVSAGTALAGDAAYDVTALTDIQTILDTHADPDVVTLNFTEDYTITSTLLIPTGVSVVFQTKEGIAAPVTIKRGASFKGIMVNAQLGSLTITVRNIVMDGGSPTISAERNIITTGGANITLRLEQGTVLQNNTVTTSSGGGAVSCAGNMVMSGNALIQNCNVNSSGGGVYLSYNDASLVMKDNASITGCTAGEDGGGIGVNNLANVTITLEGNARILGNTATRRGSGIYLTDKVDLQISDNVQLGSATDNNGVYLMNGATINGVQNKPLGANAYINIEAADGLDSSYRKVAGTYDSYNDGDFEKFHYLPKDNYVLMLMDERMIGLMYQYKATPNNEFDLSYPTDIVFTLEDGARYEDSDHNAGYNHVMIVKKDGSFVLLQKADYSVDNTGNAPVITVKASALRSLPVGTYGFSTVHWYDGFYTHLSIGILEMTDSTPVPSGDPGASPGSGEPESSPGSGDPTSSTGSGDPGASKTSVPGPTAPKTDDTSGDSSTEILCLLLITLGMAVAVGVIFTMKKKRQ